MTQPNDYQVLLETLIITAKQAARQASMKDDPQSRALAFAYADVLDAVITQANIQSVPLAELGLEGFDPYALVLKKKAA